MSGGLVASYVIAGVDLAWIGARNPTAIAVGNFDGGTIEISTILHGLYGIDSVINALGGIEDLHGVAIDGPLIIQNQTGQRACETSIGVAYGGRKASCHTSNLSKFPEPSGARLSWHLSSAGFRHLAQVDEKWQLECYPHPALIEIFGLPERLAYKKGSVAQRRSGQIELGRLIGSLEDSPVLRLRVPEEVQIYMDAGRIGSLKGACLKHNEDVLDAIVCLYIGALYQSGLAKRIFGTALAGYIYVPERKCI